MITTHRLTARRTSRYNESLELEDAVHIAILTLKEDFEGQMTPDAIEIGLVSDRGGDKAEVEMVDTESKYPTYQHMDKEPGKLIFRKLSENEVKDYLDLA